MILPLLLQAAAPAAAMPPDIQLRAHVTAKSVRVRQKGKTYLRVYAEPDAGSVANTIAPPLDTDARNVTVDVNAEARIADPMAGQP